MKLLKTLLASAVAVSAMPALAYEAGDIIVKAGYINVMPKDNNADASAVVPDTDLDVQNDAGLGLTGIYMFTPNIGLEVLAATPFEHEVEADGGALDGATIATTKHLPPTVSVQYYPMGADSKIQPYVGLGINHTFFFDEDDDAGIGTSSLKPSWGLSYSAGVDYLVDEHWLANVALWKMDIDTEIRGGAADGLEVEIDPLVVMVGAGYKF
ncbi:MAG: outer membrane protein OmpW [Oceanospirillaceae bacterium]|nr:outer membrane protein OmpW [Oceanospirillaceae bacterium]MBT13193.1 outer membrane protein OmpW [Oceanospirillaceae bacterium]|tara:strand:+ start:39258 stop:39890 length:633 start_codon:yes stop_codon:yes gene_type:complete